MPVKRNEIPVSKQTSQFGKGENMTKRTRLVFAGGYAASLCLVVATGCGQKTEQEASPKDGIPPSAMGRPPGMEGRMGGGPGGQGGMRGGPGGGQPIAANASGAEIYQAKCGCHGDQGKGKGAPALTASASKPDDMLTGIIKNGKGKMPAFASQLSDEQIQKIVAEIKQFK